MILADRRRLRAGLAAAVMLASTVARAEPPDPDLSKEQAAYEAARDARVGGLVFLGLTAAAGAGCLWGWSKAATAADAAYGQPLPVDRPERARLVDDAALGNGVAITSLVLGVASAGLSLWLLGSEP